MAAGTAKPPRSHILQLHAFPDYSLPQPPADIQVGSGTGGQQNKETRDPGQVPLRSLRPAGEQEGTHERVNPPTPDLTPLSKGKQPEAAREVGAAPAQQTDFHATGPSGSGRQQPPRTGLQLFHQQFQKNLPKAVMPHCNV